MSDNAWPDAIYRALVDAHVRIVGIVPDAGHARLIKLCTADYDMRVVSLTSEEEGVGLVSGAWLGGKCGALLMQSSGVGNCINAIASLTVSCQFPLLMLVTMRGEWGEGNPWQVPMGRATPRVLDDLGMRVATVDQSDEAGETVSAMAGLAFKAQAATAVLLSQRLIGTKSFQD